MHEGRSRNTVLTRLFEARDHKKELSNVGFFGRLGDLGSIDPRYDIAISTSCPSLDDLVVATAEDAQRCVEYLKKYNIGRARFIILDKMTYIFLHSFILGSLQDKMKLPFNSPANSQRLFDLISVDDPQFLPAFYFALRDTLVTSSLDIARSIAYRGNQVCFRVVTLDGILIDHSGTMSGGGSVKRHGLMRLGRENGIKTSKDDVSEASVKLLEEEVEVLRKQLEGKKEESATLRVPR